MAFRKTLLPSMAALILSVAPVFGFELGDTLTLIQKPLLNIPAIVVPGETLEIQCQTGSGATGWEAELNFESHSLDLSIESATYDPTTLWWTLEVIVPTPPVFELYDLLVRTDFGGIIEASSVNAVRILPARRDDWYFVHITDTHLPDHRFSDSGGQPGDSTETVDLREVIEDINFLNPEFVLLTGDLVNEGELEDYMEWRQYSRAQQLLSELEVPLYLTAGNHDLGGWDSTPPSDGTARRDWWRFFGWGRLNDPPSGAPERTQNYSFDYGPIHFTALESYINYDDWRDEYYGSDSFTAGQMNWLNADLAATDRDTRVLFYHKDFDYQINLSYHDVDMALWGHIHRNDGDINSHPFDLATKQTADEHRAYRVIRVSGDTLIPQETVYAGESGDEVLVSYSPYNDGSQYTVVALVSNLHPIPFENCLLKFVMPADGENPQLNDGTIVQIDERDGVKIYYVEVSMPADNWHTVALQLDEPTGAPENSPAFAALHSNFPNPFNPQTEIRFSLAERRHIRLSIHDSRGRELMVLAQGEFSSGDHRLSFEGRDGQGRELPSGIYLAHLNTPGSSFQQKMVLLR